VLHILTGFGTKSSTYMVFNINLFTTCTTPYFHQRALLPISEERRLEPALWQPEFTQGENVVTQPVAIEAGPVFS
jgi:hypothetical protein